MSSARIKVYFALESNRRTKAFILVPETATVDDAIEQLHEQKIVEEIWKEESVEFVGILPRSHLLDDDYRRDMATVPTSNPMSACYVADDIVLVRRSTYVDLCDISSDDDERSEHSATDQKVPAEYEAASPAADEEIEQQGHSEEEKISVKPTPKRRGKPKKKKKKKEKPAPAEAEDDRSPNNLRNRSRNPLWIKTGFQRGSNPGAYQQRGKRIGSKEGYSVYYALTDETPQFIALKYNIPGGVERIMNDNRGLYNVGRSVKLSENTELSAGAAIVLPPLEDDHPQENSNASSSTTPVYGSEKRAAPTSKTSSPSPKNKPSVAEKSRAALRYHYRKKYGNPLPKIDLPPPGLPGYAPISQPEYDRLVYTCLDGDTPIAIANKFGYNDPEELVYHNRAIYSTRSGMLEVDSSLKIHSIFLLPLSRSGGQKGANDDGDNEGVAAMSRSRKRVGYAEEDRSSGKKRKPSADTSGAKYMRERRRELELYVKAVDNDGVPKYVDESNDAPFDHARPGSLILESNRDDRRIYVCKAGETPTDIARKNRVYAPNPAGRVVFDNRARHHGIKVFTKMRDGALIVLPPARNGPRHASSDSMPSPPAVAARRPARSRTSTGSSGGANGARHTLARSSSAGRVVVKSERVKKDPDEQAYV